MTQVNALAAKHARGKLEPFSYAFGPLGDEQVEIEVDYCGICHSDLSMWSNEWGISNYPFVPGHEAVGRVVAVGPNAKNVQAGNMVGLGWNSGSCLCCKQCLRGNMNMCQHLERTMIGRHGAYGTRIRCHWLWATPIPEGIEVAKAAPLLCGGIAVFNPFVAFAVKPTDHVGVIGIGGLGHLALQFANKWGCHVTAFTSSASKSEEAKRMGAHAIVDTHSSSELKRVAGSFDLIISTVMAKLDLNPFLAALAPFGRFHTVGTMSEMTTAAIPLIDGQKSISGSPPGAPATMITMLEFCVRHKIAPVTEDFAMSDANEAFEHLEAGKARYRIVLKNDLL